VLQAQSARVRCGPQATAAPAGAGKRDIATIATTKPVVRENVR